jgi:hypothetical protein
VVVLVAEERGRYSLVQMAVLVAAVLMIQQITLAVQETHLLLAQAKAITVAILVAVDRRSPQAVGVEQEPLERLELLVELEATELLHLLLEHR